MSKLPALALAVLVALALVPSAPARAQPPKLPAGPNAAPIGIAPLGGIGGNVYAVAANGPYAYVGQGDRLVVLDVSNPAAPTRQSSLPLPLPVVALKAVGPLVYLIYGSEVNPFNSGLVIVDVHDPLQPRRLGEFRVLSGSDLDVAGTTAYVSSGANALYIIDVADPARPALRGLYAVGAPAYGVRVAGSTAFVVANDLQAVDVSDPLQPRLLARYKPTGANGAYSLKGQIAIDGGRAYVIYTRQGSGFFDEPISGLDVLDISVPATLRFLGRFGEAGSSLQIAIAGTIAYIIPSSGDLRIFDASDPTRAQLLATASGVTSAARTAPLALSASLVYVPAAEGGLVLVDVANPKAPVLRGAYRDLDRAGEVRLSGNLAYTLGTVYAPKISAWRFGLQVLDVSNPQRPQLLGDITAPFTTTLLAITGTLGLLQWNGDLQLLDLSQPRSPTLAGRWSLPGRFARQALVVGTRVYLSSGNTASGGPFNGLLQILDIANPGVPALLGSYASERELDLLQLDQNILYARSFVGNDAVLRRIDVSVSASPVLLGNTALPLPSPYADVTLDAARSLLYTLERGNTPDRSALVVYDISNPAAARLRSSVNLPPKNVGAPRGGPLVRDGNLLYTIDEIGLLALDVSDPDQPMLRGSYDLPGVSGFDVAQRSTGALDAGRLAITGDMGLELLRPLPYAALLPVVRR